MHGYKHQDETLGSRTVKLVLRTLFVKLNTYTNIRVHIKKITFFFEFFQTNVDTSATLLRPLFKDNFTMFKKLNIRFTLKFKTLVKRYN